MFRTMRRAGLLGVLLTVMAMPVLGASERKGAENTLATAEANFKKIMADNSKAIPIQVLKQAKAIAIYPGIKKAGFLVGGRFGDGLIVARRKNDSWSGPAYFNIGGASFGLQIGVESVDLILVVMTEKGMTRFMGDGFTLGADAAIAAGPVGAKGEVNVTETKADMLMYSDVQGLFAGVSFEGSKISYMARHTSDYYGFQVTQKDVLTGYQVKLPASAKKFAATLSAAEK